MEVFDGFARDCVALVDQTLPAILKIPFNYDYAFTIEVCYNNIQSIIYLLSFRQVNLPDLLKILASINSMEMTQFLSCGLVLGGNSSATLSVTSLPHRSPTPNDGSSSNSSDEVPAITHTVVFQCIGVTKEKKKYQDTLKYAKKRLDDDGVKLPVKLRPEPDSKWDSKAIAKIIWVGKELAML